MADRVGQQLGNYRLVALVGQGGYAQVYLGQHVRLEMRAAIKVLHTHLSEQKVERFQQEAQTIAGSPILRWCASWILMCRTVFPFR